MSFPGVRYQSYPKSLRDRAMAEGKYLVTIDVVRPSGSREMNCQGPYTKAEAKIILDAWLGVMNARTAAQRIVAPPIDETGGPTP